MKSLKSLLFFLISVTLFANNIYVDKDATGMNNGSSWLNAYTDLQAALQNVQAGDEIWVADGTYKPTADTDRSLFFVLTDNIEVYGGFAGDETDLEQRDWNNNETILSGDIGVVDDSTDNSYHVVVGADNAVLDGFIIIHGNANGTSADNWGGGLLNNGISSMNINNCTFKNNTAGEGGGAENYFCSGIIYYDNCVFDNNTATSGGGIASHDTPTDVRYCLFIKNSATVLYGGAMYNWGAFSSANVINCTMYDNTATESGGAIHNRASGINTKIINTILWGNTDDIALTHSALVTVAYSDIEQDGYAGSNNNISENPLFVDSLNFDLKLAAGSPCIDTGTDFYVFDSDTLVNLDAEQYLGTAPDMGLFEYDGSISSIDIDNFEPNSFALYNNYPNPFNPTTTINYQLPEKGHVALIIYNLLGEEIVKLVNEHKDAGYHTFQFNANDLSSGMYLYRIQAGEFSDVKKMLLIK